MSEESERGGAGPINQGRLFEVANTVVARGYVIAADGHLARDFRVASFVGFPQCGGAEASEVEYRRHGCGEELAASAAPRRGHTRCSVQAARGEINYVLDFRTRLGGPNRFWPRLAGF